MAGKAQKSKPKAKPAAKRPTVVKKPKPVTKPKPTISQARRIAARQERKTQPRPRQASAAPVVQENVESQSFFYKLIRFFWLLFHPGKTEKDFSEQYRKS